MVTPGSQPPDNAGASAARALRLTLITFCVLAAASALATYLIAPAIYVRMLLGAGQPANAYAYPPIVSVAVAGIVALVGVIALGVLCRWRWLFWLLLVAFTLSVLQIPASALELAGVLPGNAPIWYAVVRMLTGALLFAIGAWMIWLYQRRGVWGLGEKRR
ncbi:MAG TPA: hypothetical protein VGN32_02480 [Ktedonobacterales bacterium]|nr:hypothetical protein [Ktedonobacterales bacterium]